VSVRAPRVALLGATGVLGGEILRELEQRRLGMAELRAFASESAGSELELYDEAIPVEPLDAARVAGCDLAFCAAPGALEALLPDLAKAGTRVVDVSGTLELDASVPLALPGWAPPPGAPLALVAVPRGIALGLGQLLVPLARAARLLRASVVTLEPAAGAGQRGLEEFSADTVRVLNAQDGEFEPGVAFPQSLAFDVLPMIGEPTPGGETSEEERLREVLERLLGDGETAFEITRLRVPLFMGTLAAVHLELGHELSRERALELWQGDPQLDVIGEGDGLPTPRSAVGTDRVQLGRIRVGPPGTALLALVLTQDDVRQCARAAVAAGRALLESG
jgi:aspartate-semialdehyde dehydrogenase